MPILKNVTIETGDRYYSDDEDNSYRSQKKVSFLKLMVPLPGGQAIYELPISEEQQSSIEYAVKLAEKV